MASTCEHPMRTGRCVLDEGHRGRHSTVGFYCDWCEKTRRSRPAQYVVNPYDDTVEGQICWFCMEVQIPAHNERVMGSL